ncbi:MAG TPA: hypothetical protein VGG59_11530, partial [Acidobacteriaceae bacterium]
TDTLPAILLTALVCGTLDALAATTQVATLGMSAQRVFQGVASGILGPPSFEKAWCSGTLGLVLHYLIAFVISTIYVLASQHLPFPLRRPLIAGGLYGVAVFAVMFFIVLPLSRRPKRPFNLKFMVTQLAIHIFIVGWSIGLSARYFLH